MCKDVTDENNNFLESLEKDKDFLKNIYCFKFMMECSVVIYMNIVVSFEAFPAVMFQVKVFWVVTPCSVIVGYQHFRSPCCLHLQGEVAGMGENSIDVGLDWKGAAGAATQ